MPAQRRAEALLLAATVIWGSTFVITKGLLDLTSPLIYTSIRFLLAAVIVALLFMRSVFSARGGFMIPGIILGLLLFAGFALQTIGLQFTSASKSAFFTGMLVVFTPIFHAAAQKWFSLPRKALLTGNLLGVVLSAAGLFLLTSPEGSSFTAGDGMTLIAAALFAVYIVYLDNVSKHAEAMALTFIVFLTCGLAGGLAAGLYEEIRIVPGPDFYLPLGYLTIFATVIALGIQNRYQTDTTPTRAAVIFSLEPVIAALFAYVISGEELGPEGMAGGGIIFGGLILSELSENIPFLKRPIYGANGPRAGNG
ncbi:MAG TPA: DMT family transporter [Bacteroidota bacterium]|nr:DMT family transporter [Bacteroidota bacterium]